MSAKLPSLKQRDDLGCQMLTKSQLLAMAYSRRMGIPREVRWSVRLAVAGDHSDEAVEEYRQSALANAYLVCVEYRHGSSQGRGLCWALHSNRCRKKERLLG